MDRQRTVGFLLLESGLVDHSQNTTVVARTMAEHATRRHGYVAAGGGLGALQAATLLAALPLWFIMLMLPIGQCARLIPTWPA